MAGSRWLSRPFYLCLAGLLSACSTGDVPLERASATKNVSADQAFAMLPPGGFPVVGVIEQRFANAIQQDIVFATSSVVPGQNMLRVQMFGPVRGSERENALPNVALRESSLRREMRAAFPSVAMQRSPVYVQNSFGPFGYAVGRAGANDLCIYAWQRIASNRSNPFGNQGAIEIRLRLCQTGATERGLLALMYGFTINAAFPDEVWNPYGAPAAADPRLGTTGQLVVAGESAGYDTLLDQPQVPTPVRAAVRPARAAPPPQAPVLRTPPPGAPIVPPPPQISTEPTPVVPAPPQ